VTNNHSNSDVIVINRNLFLVIFGLLTLLVGVAIGFWVGQFAAARNFAAIQAEITASLKELSFDRQVIVEPQVNADDVQAPQAADIPEEGLIPEIPEWQDVSADDDPYLGPEDAPITIVEFSDFQCSYCARFHEQTFDKLIEEYGDQIRFVYRDYPLLGMHPEAQPAAEAAQCANDQDAFWEMHDLIFSNQFALSSESYISFAEELTLDMDAFNECLESGKYADEVLADMEEGISYGVSGTPAFFVNGRILMGAQPFENFAALIEAELNK
jgi:protein-disulfide isomerase